MSLEAQYITCTSEVEVGMGMKDVVAVKGKPLAFVSSGDRLIGRWSDAVVRFERQTVTRIERRNHAREEAVRLRCEKAVAELAVRRAGAAKQAEELRRQAERESEAYVQNLEVEKQRGLLLAMQEDVRLRQSSFGAMPSVRISRPSEIQNRAACLSR